MCCILMYKNASCTVVSGTETEPKRTGSRTRTYKRFGTGIDTGTFFSTFVVLRTDLYDLEN